MPKKRQQSTVEKSSAFLGDSVFWGGVAFVLTALGILLTSTDTVALRASKVVLVCAWLCFSVAVRKQNFFERENANRRAFGDATLSLAIAALLIGGYSYLPWQQAPKLYTSGFSRFLGTDSRVSVNIDVVNDSDYDNQSVNVDGEVKLVPYTGPHTSLGYIGIDGPTADAMVKRLDASETLRDLPHKGGLSPHVRDIFTLRSDDALTPEQIRAHHEGNLLIFVAGRLKYKDVNGCVYKSDFCGFWPDDVTLMARCHGGHFEQGVRLHDKCQTD